MFINLRSDIKGNKTSLDSAKHLGKLSIMTWLREKLNGSSMASPQYLRQKRATQRIGTLRIRDNYLNHGVPRDVAKYKPIMLASRSYLQAVRLLNSHSLIDLATIVLLLLSKSRRCTVTNC